MNKLQLLAYPAVVLLSLAASAAVFAQQPMAAPDQTVVLSAPSGKTRAQVQAELFQARADGSMKVYDDGYSQQAQAQGHLSRAQVNAELQRARAEHANRFYAYGYSQQSDARSVASRAEVRAEAIAARRSGEIQIFSSEDGGSFYMSQHPTVAVATPAVEQLVASSGR